MRSQGWLGLVLAATVAILCCATAMAQQSAGKNIAAGISYEPVARWDVERLNRILQVDTPAFAGIKVDYTPAKTGARLYRVTYPSVVPSRGNRPITTTGLVAVPEGASGTLPLVSYQHGTVYGKEQVPSFPEQSPETQLMIAQFAGQGYALIGADYFGMGASKEPEGYIVKSGHQQATYDMLTAGRAVLADLGVQAPELFIAGWSQGGFVTMAMLETLEMTETSVKAAATASAPTDMFAAFNGFLNFPRKNDASWIGTLFILTSFSFENYYGLPGLARSVLREDIYDVARRAYLREPFKPEDIPTDLKKIVRPEYYDTRFFAESAYGRLARDAQVYRWVVQTPTRNYFGEADEAISLGVGQLAATYQRAIGNDKVEAISTGATSHRGTFASAVPQWKAWFDGLRQK